MRIRMTRGVGWQNGQSLDPGTEHDIPDYWAKQFIAQGRAVPVPSEAVEVREPDAEHRDPAPARKRGARRQ